jgi:hypothetical protein
LFCKHGRVEKSDEKSWKTFYLQIVYYSYNDANRAMSLAAKKGYRDLVDFFIGKGANNWNWGMEGAAEGGHRDLVDFFIQRGANDRDGGMYSAANGGHRDLVSFFIQKGATDWDLGMYYAANGGHRDLVDFFIQKGANEWGNREILCKTNGTPRLSRILSRKNQLSLGVLLLLHFPSPNSNWWHLFG